MLRGYVEVDQLIRSGARERRVAWVRHEMNVTRLSRRQANKLQAQNLADGAEAERSTTELARRLSRVCRWTRERQRFGRAKCQWSGRPGESPPPLPFSWLRNGATGLRVRHDFPPLLRLMIRGVVSPGPKASTDR